MKEPPVYAYVVIACLPVALHFSAMLGRALLCPIRSGFDRFDRLYNRLPWVPSTLCGLFGCLALATKATPIAFYASLSAVGLLAVVDFVSAMLSFYAWANKRH